jgi:hypothetical protein
VVSTTPRPLYPPGKTRYRRLGGPQGRSGRVQKSSPPTGIRSPDRPARSQSLNRLSYPTHIYIYTHFLNPAINFIEPFLMSQQQNTLQVLILFHTIKLHKFLLNLCDLGLIGFYRVNRRTLLTFTRYVKYTSRAEITCTHRHGTAWGVFVNATFHSD